MAARAKSAKGSRGHESSRTTYTPIKPTACGIITRKFDDAKYSFHRHQVQEAKATIDTRAPESTKYTHLKTKHKKIQMEEARKMKIDHENQVLMQKMSRIMLTSGGIDNRNNFSPRSTTRATRQQELQRITQENQAILKRIQATQAHLNTQELESDFLVSRKHLAAISKFPPADPKSRAGSRSGPAESRDETPTIAVSEETAQEDASDEIDE